MNKHDRTWPDPQEIGANSSSARRLEDIVRTRLARRGVLGGMAGLTAFGAPPRSARADSGSALTFREIGHGLTQDHEVAEGYEARVLIRWGDPLFPGAPAFDPLRQTAEAQARQFGYNCDFQAFLPLPRGSTASDRGLLFVNHEYVEAHMVFPDLPRKGAAQKVTEQQVNVEIQALGASVVEVARDGATWKTVIGSLNRRLTGETPIRIGGPAAGHPRMRTGADPDGTTVAGTFGNCSGGVTPWGTILSCEENFDVYFAGDSAKSREAENQKRIGFSGRTAYGWARFHDRFNIDREPNESNRFGWVVEVDPFDPASTPVKRTALGRFRHEAATTALTADGRVAVYLGDDQRFEYLYRFVTRDVFNANDRVANRDLLDHGTLSVARFADDGEVRWLPLVFGAGKLTEENRFHSQADVVIEARRAADLAGATPLDRAEDVEPSPVSGKVYVVLTNNSTRKPDQIDTANPRAGNVYGHILEMTPPLIDGRVDHGADFYAWDVFMLAGDPANPAHGARYGAGVSRSGWLACPDNIAFDAAGRLWIASDQGKEQVEYGTGDGIWACETDGPGRAVTKMFYRVPIGAEMCGPAFTPDNRAFFVAVQHPGADVDGASFAKPGTRWPDFSDASPPRPSTVVITKRDGGIVGT